MRKTTPEVAAMTLTILRMVRVSWRNSRANMMVKIGEQIAINVRFKAVVVAAAT